MSNKRYIQAATVANEGFRGLVKASVVVSAYTILQDTDHPNFEQRAGLCRTLLFAMTPPETVAAIVELFAWWAVNDGGVIAAYEQAAGDISQIPDAVIDEAVEAFWDAASGLQA